MKRWEVVPEAEAMVSMEIVGVLRRDSEDDEEDHLCRELANRCSGRS